MKSSAYTGPAILLLGLLVGCSGTQEGISPSQEPNGDVPLQSNLGNHTYPISTSVPLAQRYFDQGLILAFGFNHAEAERFFREAQRLDPKCAMCYWGEALVLGPNINAPMVEAAVPQAYEAVQKARAFMIDITPRERSLIEALTHRYSQAVVKDRTSLDNAYADAMRQVWNTYPDDATVGSLFAEALMDLHPWNFWTKSGEVKPWTPEIIITLERVLNHSPDHPLANHLYIHAIEASPYPVRALPSAERLATLVPGSGHLVHMPAHIYLRIGRYADAARANQDAVEVDDHYLTHDHAEGIYTLAYVPHNYHFLWAAATKTGRYALAMEAALNTARKVDTTLLRDPGLAGTMQHFLILPLYTQALFGEWDTILQNAMPPEDLLYPVGVWHYVRGLAFTRLGQMESAEQELKALQTILKEPAITGLTIMALNPVSTVLKIAEQVLAAELSAQKGSYEEAISLASTAVDLEDSLDYTEPENWYLPSRQVLGAMLLEAGNAVEAEQVFREDLDVHPQNGWSLYGLANSLEAQGKTHLAAEIQQQFEKIWAEADVVLTNSRF